MAIGWAAPAAANRPKDMYARARAHARNVHHQQRKEINLENTTPSNRQHVQAWRKKNRRIDYAPITEALEIIDRLCRQNPNKTIVEILDALVIAGYAKISGKR